MGTVIPVGASPWKKMFLCSEHLSVDRLVLSDTGSMNNREII